MATRSRRSWRSRFRSGIEVAAGLALLAAAGCGGDDDEPADAGHDAAPRPECGPGDEPAEGIALTAGAQTVEYDQFRSSVNNDCTPAGREPVSLTVASQQTDPAVSNRFLVLCLRRPDQLLGDPIPLGDPERVLVIDLNADTPDGCRLDVDRDPARPLAGSITFSGVCDDGTHPDGYAIEFAATVPLLHSCDGEPDEPIEAELRGRAAVAAQAP